MNADFIAAMNPGVSWVHLAINNSRERSVHTTHPLLCEIPGAAIPAHAPARGFQGYHEGAGMNIALKHIQTRFALFLDYDFFVVRPHWIANALSHMEEQSLALLGAPYHPKYWVKFRYFPSHHCLFVDRDKIGKEFLAWDFMPQYSPEHLTNTAAAEDRKIAWRSAHPRPPSWLRRFFENIKKRRYLGTSKDICYDPYRRYHANPTVTYEYFQAAAVLHDFLCHYYLPHRWYPLLSWIERLIPNRWSFVPKQDLFTLDHFKDLGFFDVAGSGMEEYFWQGTPLGFHVRGFKERLLTASGATFNPEEKMRTIRAAVTSFSQHASQTNR